MESNMTAISKNTLTESKVCDHNWKYMVDEEHGIQKCDVCSYTRYRPNGLTYLEILKRSDEVLMEEINADPWKKKVFNFIKNDLTGIINSFRDERITFEFNDSFYDPDFLEEFFKILRSVNFKEQRYDKRMLKEGLVKLFSDMLENETFKPGKRQQSMPSLVSMVDRELFLHVRISVNL